MTNNERIDALYAIQQQLEQLLTPEEAELYPALDHLGDLIFDLEAEAD